MRRQTFAPLTKKRPDTRQSSRGRLGRSICENRSEFKNVTDGRTDLPTDLPTNTTSCRVAWPLLKTRPDIRQSSRGRYGESSNAKTRGYHDASTISFFSRVHATLHPALSVCWSVGPAVRQSVGPSHFTFL